MKLKITYQRILPACKPRPSATSWHVFLVLLLAIQLLAMANTFALNRTSVEEDKILITCAANGNYTLSGTASNHPNGYIQLTPNANDQSGQAWSNSRITLASDFNQKFSAYFGDKPFPAGGDGLAFVFRPNGTALVGALGGGLGYGGIAPSVAVEFDTYANNVPINDPAQNHTAYHVGGDYTESGRIGSNVVLNTITNNAWHDVEISWNALTKTLRTYVDGVLVNSMVRDIVALDLAGNPEVYYGFTASTATAINEQAVCIQEIIQTIPVSLTKAVSPTQIKDGEIATYTWTFNNTAVGSALQSGLSFTDLLPAFITVANPANIIFSGWAVNPTVTAVAGGNQVLLNGGTIAAQTIATVMVNITNIPGQIGTCPNPNFTNSASRISNLSSNLINRVANPCLTVIACITPAAPVIAAVTSPTCSVATGTFRISNYNAAYTYTISPAAGTSRIGDIVTAPAGTYTVTTMDVTCSSAASNAVTFTAVNNPAAPVIAAVTSPTCSVATGTFRISNYNAAYTYTISPAAGTSQIGDIVTAPAGTYTVTATDNACSSAPSNAVTFTAVNNPAAPVIAVVTSPTCSVATGTFRISNYNAAYTYTISPAAGTSRIGDIVTAPAGTYTVTTMDVTCSSAASNAVMFTAVNNPAAPVIATVTSPTCSVATGTFRISNYNAAYTYTISPAAGTSQIGDIVIAPVGTYTVTATDNACSSALSNAVTFAPVTNCCMPNTGTMAFSTNQSGACLLAKTPVNFTNTANNMTTGYVTAYVLTDNSGVILKTVVSGFNAPVLDGTYKIYAVNYAAFAPNTSPVFTAGININAIGGTCAATGTPVVFCVTQGCKIPLTPISFAASGQNTNPAYTTLYALTDNAGKIISTHTASPIPAPATTGAFRIYAINYLSARAPDVSAGASISLIEGDCSYFISNPISVCITTDPLPVKLASFTVVKEADVAHAAWTTSEEVNADHYSIERSSNAKSDWMAIGQQKAVGNSLLTSAYSFTDTEPLKGTGYYRLKMVDVDGSVAYSRIRSLDFGDKALQAILYPNPVSTTLFLKDVNAEDLKQVTIINYKGQIMYRSAALPASGGINVNHFPAGSYILKLTDKAGINQVRKFAVAH